jgi:release factor glutamine methyltransferase
MQVQKLLNTAVVELTSAGIEQAGLEAQLLLQACLHVSRSDLFLLHDQPAKPVQEQRFFVLLSRRCKREPLQYILGSCEFWSLEFYVTPAVLIPRPETEFLLEHVFATLAGDHGRTEPVGKILDLCTGSGVIAVVLGHELDHTVITAVDRSCDALAVARRNIACHSLAARINLVCADLLTSFKVDQMFDLIVTNPPYVLAGDLPGLEPEVRDWEPELALSGGRTGMDVIDRICQDCCCHLKPGGWLFMEIGADIREQVLSVFGSAGRYEQVKVVQDWSGRPRVLQAKCIE